MLTNLFESRNKTFLNLVKLGDYLGRSLRENVELFSVEEDEVTYLTESGHVVKGNYNKSGLNLTNILVEDISLFEDKEIYSKLVDKKINNLLADILVRDLSKANDSFDSVLNLWETRLHFDRVQKKLNEKCEKFNDSLKITTTPEFARLNEVKKEIVKFLKESDNFINIPEIRNTIKLSSVISKSFNTPKLSLNNLSETKNFSIPNNVNHTLYDHLCKQELIAKELVEAKNNLDHIWMTNEKVQKLPSFIYESDENVMNLVAEIISELPYFAIANKKQINSLVEGNLDLLAERDVVSSKDVNAFVAKIFEFKKPVRKYLMNVLNEKYGINIQNLTDPPTFNSLIKTQIVIFESLAKLSPKNSVIKKVLYEFSEILKTKNGIESIDVSDFLNEIFKDAEYTSILNETSLMNYLNFDKVADDLGKIGQVLKMIQAGMGMGAAGGAPAPGGMNAPAAEGMAPEGSPEAMAQQPLDGEGEFETDGGPLAGMGDDEGAPQMDAESAADEVNLEDELQDEEGGLEGEGDDFEVTDSGELADNLKELESLISVLKDEIGMGEGDGEEMGGDMPMGDEGEEGGEEGEMPSEEGSEEGDDFGGEDSGEDFGGEEGEEDSGEEEDEEAPPPMKKKPKKGKPE